MNLALPAVALTEAAHPPGALDWVGMSGVDLPMRFDDGGRPHQVHARADVQLELPDASAKGIHMSRLYGLLDAFAERSSLTPGDMQAPLRNLIDSHADWQSTSARPTLGFDLLYRLR